MGAEYEFTLGGGRNSVATCRGRQPGGGPRPRRIAAGAERTSPEAQSDPRLPEYLTSLKLDIAAEQLRG